VFLGSLAVYHNNNKSGYPQFPHDEYCIRAKAQCFVIKCMLLAVPFMQYTRGLQYSLLSESETESVKEKPDEEIRLITLLSLPACL
jgi:hypothetical protein